MPRGENIQEIDKEIKELCEVMNYLPGIEVTCSTSGENVRPINIWFHVKNTNVGLFVLTRCSDRRYWVSGGIWSIELSVGDMFEDNHLPITYCLNSGNIVGEEAYGQAKCLLNNISRHLSHEGFTRGFNINIQTPRKVLIEKRNDIS